MSPLNLAYNFWYVNRYLSSPRSPRKERGDFRKRLRNRVAAINAHSVNVEPGRRRQCFVPLRRRRNDEF